MDLRKLFDHMKQEYDVTPLDSQMHDTIMVVQEIISDAQAESPTVGDNEVKSEICPKCKKDKLYNHPNGNKYCSWCGYTEAN